MLEILWNIIYLLMSMIGLLIAGSVPGFFVSLCCLLSVWLAFGSTRLVIRLPVFLLATLPIGLLATMMAESASALPFYLVVLMLTTIGAVVWEDRAIWFGGFLVLFVVFIAVVELQNGALGTLWFARSTMAVGCLGLMMSMLRLLGFRLIQLTTDVSAEDVELATPHSLSEWIEILDEAGAASWTYADIVIFLRQYGFSYHWQKVITVVYEKSLGRRICEKSADGHFQQIETRNLVASTTWLNTLSRQRFTTGQLMTWSIAAACLFAFFRFFSRLELTTEHVAVTGTVILAMATIGFFALMGTMTIRDRYPRWICFAVVMLVAIALPHCIPFYRGWPPVQYGIMSITITYAIWLNASLLLIRRQGYRLVRLASSSSNPYASPVAGQSAAQPVASAPS